MRDGYGQYVEGADGTRLFVQEQGEGPTILWIHGYCQSHLAWDQQFTSSELNASYRQVRLDLRGHGLSDKSFDAALLQDGATWAADIKTVIDTLHLHRPVLAGWSYGGYVICDYIRKYGQDDLSGLIFIAAATEMGRAEANALLGPYFLQLIPGFFSTDYSEGIAALRNFLDLTTYAPLNEHTFYQMLGVSALTLPEARRALFRRRLDNTALLQSITLPTLIVQGSADRIILPTCSDHLARHIPHAARIGYDRCGHLPFLEMAAQFNHDIATFLHELPSM
jgi:non-heme chloroperoxidase